MKTRMFVLAGTLAATTLLVGCDKVKSLMGKKPEGQVVATVNGQEITTLELRAEMGGFGSKDPAVMKRAQQAALQQIIMRDLLVQKAKEAKLDKAPDYAVQVRRGEQGLLAQSYERKLATGVAVPTRADAETYIAAHPEQFADRRVLTIDQIVTGGQPKIDQERMKAIKTLEEVKALFESSGVPYQETVSTIDTLSVDPRLTQQIEKLPPGEVFVIPQRGAIVFNRLTQSRAVPFRGDQAVTYTINLLRQQRSQESVRQQLMVMRKAAETKIVYNDAYKELKMDPTAPPQPAVAAPAAGAAPAARAPATKAP